MVYQVRKNPLPEDCKLIVDDTLFDFSGVTQPKGRDWSMADAEGEVFYYNFCAGVATRGHVPDKSGRYHDTGCFEGIDAACRGNRTTSPSGTDVAVG